MNRASVYFPRSADEGKQKTKKRVCFYQYAHHCTFENLDVSKKWQLESSKLLTYLALT